MTSEVDTNIVQICTQPHLLITFEKGIRRAYYPDIAERTHNGAIRIVEVKKSLSEISAQRDYEHKLELANSVYGGLGWTFHKIDKKLIEKPSTRFKNIRLLHDLGRLRISLRHRAAMREVFARSGGKSVELGHIAESLGGWRVGAALVGSMMIHRQLSICLDWPLGPGSEVTPIVGGEGIHLSLWPWQEAGRHA